VAVKKQASTTGHPRRNSSIGASVRDAAAILFIWPPRDLPRSRLASVSARGVENLKKPHPISGRLGGMVASGAKIVWPIPDLINELRID
jgi:hypothetical protein